MTEISVRYLQNDHHIDQNVTVTENRKMMPKTDRAAQSKDEETIFPKAVRYADFLMKHGAKAKLHRQGTFLTATTGPFNALKQRNKSRKVKEESRKAISSAETSDSSGRNTSLRKEDNLTTDIKLRFPILGPTRQDTQLYFKRRRKTRLTFEDLKDECKIKDEKEGAKNSMKKDYVYQHTRSKTLQHISPTREQKMKEDIQTLTRSLPNLVVSVEESLDTNGEKKKLTIPPVPQNLKKEKTLYPSVHGFHPRSYSPTYKKLVFTKETLQHEMKERLKEIKRIKTARTAENFYKKYLAETNDEDLAVIQTMEFMQDADIETAANSTEIDHRTISLKTPMPERCFKFDKSIFELGINVFLPHNQDNDPVNSQSDKVDRGDKPERRIPLPGRSISHLSLRSNDGHTLSPIIRSPTKAKHKLKKSGKASPKKLPKREIASPVHDPISTEDVETLISAQTVSSDIDEAAIDTSKVQSNNEDTKPAISLDSENNHEGASLTKSKTAKHKTRKKAAASKQKEPELPKLTIASDFDVLVEEHSKHPKIPLHSEDKEDTPSSSKSRKTGETSSVDPLQETVHGEVEGKATEIENGNSKELKENKKSKPVPKPNSLADNKLIFDRQKSKAVTRLARMSNLTAEEANDLWLTRDAKILGSKYIDQYNKMAFGSDSESDDDV